MLVLTRRVGEQIVIGSDIRVTLLGFKGASVRLGVTAPASVPVDRQEIHERRRLSGSRSPPLTICHAPQGASSTQTVQHGDRVQVQYVKRFQDGSVTSSRAPLELTVGIDHPRLPGLGLALLGLAPGGTTTVQVPAERAYGPPNSAQVHRLARTRFPRDQLLPVGKWVRIPDRQRRSRLVRIVEVRGPVVVVDSNHRWAGQAMELEVQLVAIQAPAGS